MGLSQAARVRVTGADAWVCGNGLSAVRPGRRQPRPPPRPRALPLPRTLSGGQTWGESPAARGLPARPLLGRPPEQAQPHIHLGLGLTTPVAVSGSGAARPSGRRNDPSGGREEGRPSLSPSH
jgi:hypothetical protein